MLATGRDIRSSCSNSLERNSLVGSGRLLDLGCGTGQLGLGMARDFEEIVGMDPDPEMLAEARATAGQLGIENITWAEGGSQDLDRLSPQLGQFRLVTMGRSFHWMDQESVLESLAKVVLPGGGLALAGDGSINNPTNDWQQGVKDIVRKWLGETRRAGSSTYVEPTERHEKVIARSAFKRVEVHNFAFRRNWTLETIIGHLYSTSFCSLPLLGNNQEPFEADLRQRLLAIEPSGRFIEDVNLEAILAWME